MQSSRWTGTIDMRVQSVSREQILQELHARCQRLAAYDCQGFRQEFEELNDVGKDLAVRAGESDGNREKNRYPYILPYDHCRVRLSVQNADPHSDYINANFVPGGGSERDFICTQGPLRSTTADFWKMVWEQNVRIIVMVTALKHKDNVLCDKYWPQKPGSVLHGLFQVTTLSRKQGPDYVSTAINLRHRDSAAHREVTHYYYPAWPDQGVPREPCSLCAFTEHVRQHLGALPRLGPAVVHCSAGVGRSGTFVTLLWLMQLCVRGVQPDVRAAVEDLRLHRMWMVQNLEQYIFIHQCLLYWLSGGTVAWRPRVQGASHFAEVRVRHRGSSAPGEREDRRRRHNHGQNPPTDQPQNAMLKFLHPGNLLRRLLPASSPFNSGEHAS